MIQYVNRKSMEIRYSGRSSDYISPSFEFGCLYQCSYCVLPSTLITTPDGLKIVEEIQEGDEVISYNQETEKLEKDLVTQVGSRQVEEYYVLEYDHGTLELTGEHPVYTKNRGWVETKYLTLDDELLYVY